MSVPPVQQPDGPSVRAILRVVATVVLSVLALYLAYLVRTPIGYVLLGAFVAIAATGPVNLLSRKLPRGPAIAIVYLGIVFLPILLGLILIPPAVEQGVKLANRLPDYARDLNDAFDKNPQLKEANEKYDITGKLEHAAESLVSRLGDAAGALVDIGAGLVSSVFALVTILVISMFLIGAVIILLLDLIPLVGATLGAVLVGVVTLFVDFPTTTIIWAIFAIAYQQFENYVVQPRIQSRAVALDPFLVVVAALFGGALLGVTGALLSIPTAASIQIAVREWLDYRRTPGGAA